MALKLSEVIRRLHHSAAVNQHYYPSRILMSEEQWTALQDEHYLSRDKPAQPYNTLMGIPVFINPNGDDLEFQYDVRA